MLTFIYPHDDVFAAVKQEASLYAIRQTSKEGDPLFENLVFDEAYLPKFRELFFNAQAKLLPVLSTYQRDIPVEPEYFERKDFSQNRDFVCHLNMPDDFDAHLGRAIEDHIFSFLKDWIMYKWLETKMPDVALVFLNNCTGEDGYLKEIKRTLERRTKPIRRRHSFF